MMIVRQNYVAYYWKTCNTFYSSTTTKLPLQDLPAPAYQPKNVENKYQKWIEKGVFKPDVSDSNTGKTFCMVLPPPNVTGKLHLGHALTCTIQDVIARRKRSLGYNVLWIPGMDHAGIATQTVVEKHIKGKYDVDRHLLGRDCFNKHVWEWKNENARTILEQLRRLGCSLDWGNQTFTMDKDYMHAVNTAFVELFKEGLIYRKKSLVNWCGALQSTVSDIEVDNLTITRPMELNVQVYSKPVKFGLLYTFPYRIFGTNETIVVSTTMPETMLGDVAIAVHPDDERYKHLRNKRALHPFRNVTIPIILDKFVDPKFGTGAVKITPAHSKIDYKIAQDHKLPLLQVFDENGVVDKLHSHLNTEAFKNLNRYECRDVIIRELAAQGLFVEEKPHNMSLPVCSRTGDVIECIPKEQWFMNCKGLNKEAAEAVESGELNIEPEKFNKNWKDWTKGDRDWCISRQLWWGHQIPAYKCTANGAIVWVASMDEESARKEAATLLRAMPEAIKIEQDSDVLDTWFSSGIYPFAALGWPEVSQHYNKFYPLDLMVTGHDILGFWVHRMVMLGSKLTDKLPFNNVLLHGVICDNKGAKMSKSKGNVIDPVDIINGITLEELKTKSKQMHSDGILSKEELDKAVSYHRSNFSNTKGIPECGVDALRFTLLSQDIKSHFVNFDVSYCHANKLFCNKMWQSVKYLQLCHSKLRNANVDITVDDLTFFDRWILSKLSFMVSNLNTYMDNYDFHLATKALRTLIYNQMCDVYIEATKPGFDGIATTRTGYAHSHTLAAVLNTSLRCLNPFMIYVTEELIPIIPNFENNIIINFNDKHKPYFDFPKSTDFEIWKNDDIEQKVDKLLEALVLVRELKGQYKIPNDCRPSINIKTNDEHLVDSISQNMDYVIKSTKCSKVSFNDKDTDNTVKGYLDRKTEVGVEVVGKNMSRIISEGKENLLKKINRLEDSLVKLEHKFNSNSYINNVPEYKRQIDQEKYYTKKEELKQLQRFVDVEAKNKSLKLK